MTVKGLTASLSCHTIPPTVIFELSFYLFLLLTGLNPSTKPGLWGGSVSTLELHVNVTQDMDGIVYTCQSINEVLQRSVHEAISLDILCKLLVLFFI